MDARPLATAIVLLALLGATAPLASTQAAEIGEGVEIVVGDGPNGQYTTVDSNGQVQIDMTAANRPAGGGVGVLPDARTNVDDTFVVVNTNDRRAFVYVRDESDALAFYPRSDTDASLEGAANEVRLDSGEQLPVGLTVDATDRTEDIDATFTVVARVSELVAAALDVGPQPIPADEPAVFDASGSTGDALVYDYRFDDGVTRTDAGSQVERTFAEPGTYTVNLSVTETTGAADDGRDVVVREFVVAGEGEAETLDDDATATLEQPEQNTTDAVEAVELDLDESVDGIVRSSTLAVESLDDVTGEPVPGEPIAAANVSLPADEDETNATMDLVVSRADTPSIDPEVLVVERYDDATGTWQTLPTATEDVTDDTVVVEVETPGFSPFAVTEQEGEGDGDGPTGGDGDEDGDTGDGDDGDDGDAGDGDDGDGGDDGDADDGDDGDTGDGDDGDDGDADDGDDGDDDTGDGDDDAGDGGDDGDAGDGGDDGDAGDGDGDGDDDTGDGDDDGDDDDADDRPVDRIDDDDDDETTGPAFRVVDLEFDATEVTPGESVTVSTTVESTRIVASNAVVELRLDGDRLRTQRVSLAAGASATVEFTDVRLDGVAPGEYTLGVYTDEASRTATVTVIDAAGETVERDGDATEGEDRLDETAPPSDTEPADDDVPEAEDDAGVTDDGTPGFGVVLVLTALVAFLVLARHRSQRNR